MGMPFRQMEQPFALPLPRLLVNDPVTQISRLNARMRMAACEEVECEWFLHGREGMDEGKPFRHPAGVQCGDHRGCTDDNCPCPSRLRYEIVNGRLTGRRGHVKHDVDCRQPVQYVHATQAGPREVIEDEWVTRLHEGVDAYNHSATRGL